MAGSGDSVLFNKFEILDCLKKDVGVGVYIANHIYLGKRILLKTLDREHIPDPAMLSRFQREAKTLAQLDHPNIIDVLDFGTLDQFFYISFEYFKSRTLRDVILAGEVSENQKRHILVQLLRGLDYAHAKQIIHRDIKPENILLDDEGRLKIADFGLAHVRGEASFTQQASIVGTPSYMSPEQIRGEELTAQSDLFSIGIVAYELFSGSHPFLGADVGATLNNILSQQVVVAEEIQSDDVRAVIAGLLQKNTRDRLPSAAEALRALGEVRPEPAGKPTPPAAHRRPAKFIIGFIVLSLMTLLAISVMQRAQKREPVPTAERQETPSDSSMVIAELGGVDVRDRAELQEPIVAESAQPQAEPSPTQAAPGRLIIDCRPWAYVYVDSQLKNTTPLQQAILLWPGEHEIQLKHPNFPPYVKNIRIEAEQEVHLAVTLCSYLTCNIYPWGDVYLNDVLLGQTPFSALPISPGEHVLTVKNQQYGSISRGFAIAPGDTFFFTLNFEQEKLNEVRGR